MNFPSIPPFDQLRQLVFTDPTTAYVIADIGRIRKTTDGGSTWSMLSTGTTDALFGIDFVNATTAYACGDHGTIIRTTDAGEMWTAQSSGLNEFLYGIDFTAPDTGYICSWSGKILKTTNGGVTFIQQPWGEQPSGFGLMQNFPNPFNPATSIVLNIPTQEFVRLTVVDILGREVAILLNERKEPGEYSLRWDASDHPSGVYFCTVQAGSFRDTKKLVLSR
jgi:photosystem II stability/assembly factor-like uncharacterized protein